MTATDSKYYFGYLNKPVVDEYNNSYYYSFVKNLFTQIILLFLKNLSQFIKFLIFKLVRITKY